MNAPRFNGCRRPAPTSHAGSRKNRRWIRVLDLGPLRNSVGSEGRKIFAIVPPPMPADPGGKTIRRILIFDDHPDSLRLVSESNINSEAYLVGLHHTIRPYIILGLVLSMILLLAMLWPLL